MKNLIFITSLLILILLFSPLAFSKQFYASDFEGETIGKSPKGWELGFKGNGNGEVIEDPVDPKNKIFAHSDLPMNQARHDVGGNIWVIGDASWKDYIVEYDAYFPEDFYIGILFRFVNENEFYLFDRRSAGEAGNFDFWKRGGGNWTRLGTGIFDAQPQKWYRFRIVLAGDSFEAYSKSRDDKTSFNNMQPILTGKDATYKEGKFGLYGLIYIDNIAIGETDKDLFIAVESYNKLPAVWGNIKGY